MINRRAVPFGGHDLSEGSPVDRLPGGASSIRAHARGRTRDLLEEISIPPRVDGGEILVPGDLLFEFIDAGLAVVVVLLDSLNLGVQAAER